MTDTPLQIREREAREIWNRAFGDDFARARHLGEPFASSGIYPLRIRESARSNVLALKALNP
jgi:hypothetical protein